MKSGKQRRQEILQRRRDRGDPFSRWRRADLTQVIPPGCYRDRLFKCRDCGTEEVWTAKQQKWWFEKANGNIYSTAARCRACRALERGRVEEARRASHEGLLKKQRLLQQDNKKEKSR